MKSKRNTTGHRAAVEQVSVGQSIAVTRRKLLQWVPPVVTAISLPVHATLSINGNSTAICRPLLVAFASVSSKCSGPANALVGQATITIITDGDPVEITAITHNAGVSDTISLPALPATVSVNAGIDIGWQGPASDALVCLPVNTITLTVEYNCNGATAEESINVTQVLAAAVA